MKMSKQRKSYKEGVSLKTLLSWFFVDLIEGFNTVDQILSSQRGVFQSTWDNIPQLRAHLIMGYHKAPFWARLFLFCTSCLWAPFFSKHDIAFPWFAAICKFICLYRLGLMGLCKLCWTVFRTYIHDWRQTSSIWIRTRQKLLFLVRQLYAIIIYVEENMFVFNREK